MPPQTGTALLILVAFALPGFTTVLFKERMHEAERDVNPLERLLQTGYYSVWCYLLLATVGWLVGVQIRDIEGLYTHWRSDPFDLVFVAGVALLVPSVAVANAGRLWLRSPWRATLYRWIGINARHRVPTAWDCFFAKRSRAMVLATLQDGRVVGGYYGRESFAAYAKDGRDLYLEQRWTLDGENWFEAPALDTQGVWIPTEEVVSVELYCVNDEQEETN